MNRKKYLLNHWFIAGLVVLFLNDTFLKNSFGNNITGKLSDIAGVFILPFFISFFFPQKIKINILSTAIFFIWWKSPFSQAFINIFNQAGIVTIWRVVDFSDLIALLVLPFSYFLLSHPDKIQAHSLKIHPALILVPTTLILSATSVTRIPYVKGTGNLLCYKCNIEVRMSKDKILHTLKNNNIPVYRDTLLISDSNRPNITLFPNDTILQNSFYKIDELIIGKDTLKDIQFSLVPGSKKPDKTTIYFNSVNMPPGVDVNKIRPYVFKLFKKFMKKQSR